MTFKVFSEAVHRRYTALSHGELFVTDVGDIFASYLAAFPPGTNPIFRERTEHDCNCCKQFIRKLGVLVAIDHNGKQISVWDDLDLPSPYREVAETLSNIVRQAPIVSVFRSKERQYGTEYNYDTHTNQRWDHFHGRVGAMHFARDPEAKRGEKDAAAQVLRRGLKEIRQEDIQTALELIDNNALYRGSEHTSALHGFSDLLRRYKGDDTFVWANINHHAARFRNTVIGTLLVDLAEGKSLEDAVRSFEGKVAPHNYKRPKALITQRMVDEAVATLNTLGLEGAVHRRFARIGDVSVNNVLFVDNSVRGDMKDGIKGLLADSVKPRAVDTAKAEKITIGDFEKSIMPGLTSLSVLVENRHLGNFVSLTGGDGPERMFKWYNNFAWSYDGEVTDSIKQRVKAAGGNISAKLRVSLAWFNYDDLDIHAFEPGGRHICFSNKCGILDVDMNAAGRRDSRTPVENLAFNTLRDGAYRIKVNNYSKQEFEDEGFTLEVEYEGAVHSFSYPRAVPDRATVDCLELTIRHGKLDGVIVGPGLTGGEIPTDKWGVKTGALVPVSIALHSPNYWNDQKVGQQHWFFMLQGCRNPAPVRGIYNEFLRPDLDKHRKVFEVLGAKTKCPPTDDQLSGVGFSAARNDSVTVVVNGRRAYNITF